MAPDTRQLRLLRLLGASPAAAAGGIDHRQLAPGAGPPRQRGSGQGPYCRSCRRGFEFGPAGPVQICRFFAGTITALTGDAHQGFNIILPLGISFFTFQQISYLVDLRRGQAPVYSLTDYALYVSFFPQLIAGPIVRHNQVIFQYAADPRRDGLEERLARGCTLLIIGMAKKMLLADGLADIADPLYAAGGGVSAGEAWLAAVAFGGQIYFDFSGYSDMAIGLGLMFGIVLPANFDRPYAATSIRDFWRRWHMTLSGFLRDYLYIPLGGSRRGHIRQVGAILATMLLGGLWHGAGWTFIALGGAAWRGAHHQSPLAVAGGAAAARGRMGPDDRLRNGGLGAVPGREPYRRLAHVRGHGRRVAGALAGPGGRRVGRPFGTARGHGDRRDRANEPAIRS